MGWSRLFLSCLFGSEQMRMVCPDADVFLSCLFGSELHVQFPDVGKLFLSCLFGSELLLAVMFPD